MVAAGSRRRLWDSRWVRDARGKGGGKGRDVFVAPVTKRDKA
jgi:hypothetical protein